MRIHYRFDSSNEQHTHQTIFINGRNCGTLCTSPDEADWLYLVIEKGCEVLSPKGLPPIEFQGSGSHRPDQALKAPPSL